MSILEINSKQIIFFLHNYYIGENMSGIGLRTFELAQALSAYFKIAIICLRNTFKNDIENILIYEFGENWKKLIDSSDIVVFNDLPLKEALIYSHTQKKYIITENAIPLEHLEYDTISNSPQRNSIYFKILEDFNFQLSVSNHFIVRSDIEYCTLLAILASKGRINYDLYQQNKMLSTLISIVPIGFSRCSLNITHNIESNTSYDILWTGGLWNYMDIPSLLTWIKQYTTSSNLPRFLFMYVGNDSVPLLNTTLLKSFIYNNPSLPLSLPTKPILHSERDSYLKGAKAFICIGKKGIENLTCIRLRIRDTLLYCKPIIIDNNGATSDFVRKYDIGYIISDYKDFEDAINDIKSESDRYKQKCQNIKSIQDLFCLENNVNNLKDVIMMTPNNGTTLPVENGIISLNNILYSNT